MIGVGWGRDINGDPVPANPEKSGEYHPDFRTNTSLWKAGPVDLRWDDDRGVWTGTGGSGGGGFAIVKPTGEPVPGIGALCDAAEAVVITASCGSGVNPGDVIYIWDLCRNWLNMPPELLVQTTFNVQNVKVHEDEGNRPPSLVGNCRWAVTGMCCVESSIYEY